MAKDKNKKLEQVLKDAYDALPATTTDRDAGDVVRPLAPVADAVARLESEAGIAPMEKTSREEVTEDDVMALHRLHEAKLPGESLVQAVERLEALARAVSAPAVGLIVQETAPSMYKVHVVESDADGVRVWDTEPGAPMPWHAAKVLVDRVVETKLTPEDKR